MWDGRAYFEHQLAAGTNDADATSGSWEDRAVNTTVEAAAWAVLAANVVTLTKGRKYFLRALVPAQNVNSHQARINDTTAGVTYPGSSQYCMGSARNLMNRSEVVAVIDLTGAGTDHDVKVQSRVSLTSPAGYGIAVNFDEVEVYTSVEIWRYNP